MWKNLDIKIRKAQVGETKWSCIYMYSNSSNCKLKTFENVGSYLTHDVTEKNTIKAIKEEIKKSSVGFLHLSSLKALPILQKHFKIMSAVKVHVGYDEPQYHFTIAHKDAWLRRKSAPTTDIIEELASTSSKKKIKQILEQYLILIDK